LGDRLQQIMGDGGFACARGSSNDNHLVFGSHAQRWGKRDYLLEPSPVSKALYSLAICSRSKMFISLPIFPLSVLSSLKNFLSHFLFGDPSAFFGIRI